MHCEAIYAELRKLAPSVCFSASREVDPYFTWDGDGEDPVNNGYTPYDVDVTASVIVGGVLVQETDSLGGCYFMDDEPIGDIHGYLPQMIQEAAVALLHKLPANIDPALVKQLQDVDAFLSSAPV